MKTEIKLQQITTDLLYFSIYVASSLLGINEPDKIYRDLWCLPFTQTTQMEILCINIKP